jgi:cytosine/adenosine deaminase-related metal-dependent hydrolase
MRYRKFSASLIFDGFRFVRDDRVLIARESGEIIGIVPIHEAGDDIETVEGIVCPGFVNCHAHLELSHMKGMIPEKGGLVDFVVNVVEQRHLPEEQILSAITRAEDEMLQNGIVACGDICNNLLSLPQKTRGRVRYHNFIEASGYHPAIAQARFERSMGFHREYLRTGPATIVPHAPYSVSGDLWEMITHFPGNDLLTIHNQETEAENEWSAEKTGAFEALYQRLKVDTDFYIPSGKSSLQSYLDKFLPGQQVILVHNVHTTHEDIAFSQKLDDNRFFWCICAAANQYISGTMPDITMFLEENCEIVLGTDSLASNTALDLMHEISIIRRHFPSLDEETLLRWATSNGARALMMEDQLGSFEPGKIPGILHVDPELTSARRLL